MKNHKSKLFIVSIILLAAISLSTYSTRAVADRRFEICTFCCPCYSTQHLCQAQFDALNYTNPNGHFVLMGSDAHRAELNARGNFLGIYYNVLNDNYGSWTATQKADDIENNYVIPNFTSTGVKPTWIALNEISSSWVSDANYRAWVIAVASRLKNTYSHTVITFTYYDNPGTANASSWQSLAAVSYIAVEKYLSGATVNANGNSVSWCQTQYQTSLNTWLANTGVSSTKLYYGEDFAQTTSGSSFGRAGCSYAGWDNAIKARADAAHNIGFAGYFSYAWNWNQMNVSDADLIHFEGTYAAKTLP
jgi:hypothetical protein